MDSSWRMLKLLLIYISKRLTSFISESNGKSFVKVYTDIKLKISYSFHIHFFFFFCSCGFGSWLIPLKMFGERINSFFFIYSASFSLNHFYFNNFSEHFHYFCICSDLFCHFVDIFKKIKKKNFFLFPFLFLFNYFFQYFFSFSFFKKKCF